MQSRRTVASTIDYRDHSAGNIDQSERTDEHPEPDLADFDPEVAALDRRELARQRAGLEMIASENHTAAGRDAGAGLGADQQVRRGLPGPALLRRLRARRRRSRRSRSTGSRRCSAPSTPTSSRTPGAQANASVMHALIRPGDTDPRPEPGPRRPPDPRHEAQLLRQALQRRRLRGGEEDHLDRHGRGRATWPGSTSRS